MLTPIDRLDAKVVEVIYRDVCRRVRSSPHAEAATRLAVSGSLAMACQAALLATADNPEWASLYEYVVRLYTQRNGFAPTNTTVVLTRDELGLLIRGLYALEDVHETDTLDLREKLRNSIPAE